MKTYDAIVIGAGHNGLTSAAFLARAGLRTLIVEKNDHVGGAMVPFEDLMGHALDGPGDVVGRHHPRTRLEGAARGSREQALSFCHSCSLSSVRASRDPFHGRDLNIHGARHRAARARCGFRLSSSEFEFAVSETRRTYVCFYGARLLV